MLMTLSKSVPFLLGFGFAFLPSYGPFLGLLFFFAARWSLERSDLLWAGAALLLAIPLGAHHGYGGFFFGLVQVLAPWLVYRAFSQLQAGPNPILQSRTLGIGLLSGLALVVGLSWLQIDLLNFEHAKTVSQAIVWESNPALYGHTVLALGALIAILMPTSRMRLASMGLAALGVLVSGSREAAIAWVIVAVALLFVNIRRSKREYAFEVLLLAVMMVVAAGVGSLFGWGRVGFLLDLTPTLNPSKNLVQGSEIALGDWWDAMGVKVQFSEQVINEERLVAYTVTKVGTEPWLRLQQIVPIKANTPYTVSAWVRAPDSEAQPGIQGWGQTLGADTFTLIGTLRGEVWTVRVSGPGRLVGSGIVERYGEWQRVWASFVYEGETSPLYWYVGLSPDNRTVAGTSATFAGFQLEEGEIATPYVPGPATRGLSLGVARMPYWQAGWHGVTERPWLGWGQGAFPHYYLENWPDTGPVHEPPSHVHNSFLHVLFERGLIGFTGLAVLVAALGFRALRKGDMAFLAVFGAILFMSAFDSTLFYGGIIYPLAAIAGWRAASYRKRLPREETTSRQLGVSATLAVGDFLAALGALTLAQLLFEGTTFAATSLASAPSTLFYALLLWPAMAWREGLYPGYGLGAPQELKKQVSAAAYAGLLLAAGTLLFYDHLPLPRTTLVAMVLLSAVLAPVIRAGLKRALLYLDFWGRPVVVLGAGQAGRRVIRSLQKRPLDGLHPVALFDDDPAKIGTWLEGVPVEGPLDHADAYALANNVQHAIVAIPTASSEKLGELVNRRSPVFKRVQFVPDLEALPSQDVYTSELDGMLALEVRRGLYSRRNQLTKRLIDLTLSTIGIAVLAPLLLMLYVWVKLDSRGPALYRSERIGQRGEVFACLKYRSMYLDAETRLEEVLRQDEALRHEYERFHKLDDDPRLTRAGRIMRRFSLDELPQLYNVLKGEMSLVGPRPYLTREYEAMGAYRGAILEAKPGITGYWQVSGRSNVTFQDRLEMEAYYVRNWSIWWDIVILVQTVATVIRREGAR